MPRFCPLLLLELLMLAAHSFRSTLLTRTLTIIVVLLVCTYVMSFAWSWGPLGWLIPSETFPLETRTTGFAFAVSTNMLFTSIIAQLFLTIHFLLFLRMDCCHGIIRLLLLA
ncbi:hypothetical protein MTR67_008023 [Solanum verrucosum]|uniref:Uncharacterized protein n=1 Tax=Solanum verrucosum TaxID=315347 RepID=A0AAF0Q149_SOLVR|nr:hypothetical protein MTR67_008023 [Solanum verrucosum]